MDLRDILKKKADSKRAGEAATTEETDLVADESPDDIPFGWVEGVDPTVGCDSLGCILLYVIC